MSRGPLSQESFACPASFNRELPKLIAKKLSCLNSYMGGLRCWLSKLIETT